MLSPPSLEVKGAVNLTYPLPLSLTNFLNRAKTIPQTTVIPKKATTLNWTELFAWRSVLLKAPVANGYAPFEATVAPNTPFNPSFALIMSPLSTVDVVASLSAAATAVVLSGVPQIFSEK